MILNEFECQGKKVKVLHYADMLKYVAEKYFDWDGQKNEEGRTLLQKLGTDIARNKDNDYWVRMLAYTAEMFFTDYDYIIIPDCRFPNEIEYWQKGVNCEDIISVRITRDGYISELTEEQQEHPSETALDNYDFDYFLVAKDLAALEILAQEFCTLI